MTHRRRLLLSGIIIGLLAIGGLVIWHQHSRSTPSTTRATTSTSHPKKTQTPLTLKELARHPKLTYSCIIYHAIQDTTRLPRWQEVADFKTGWQVERYYRNHQWRYLVWPDQHITDAEKNLAPNWFTLSTHGRVFYDSMIVHSFRKDQTQTTTLTQIIRQINHAQAAKTVRQMPQHLTVVRHH